MKITDNKFLLSLVVLAVYFLCSYGFQFHKLLLPDVITDNHYLSNTSAQLIFFLAIPIVTTALLFGWRNLRVELCLDGSFTRGFGFALLATLPMAVGYAIVSGFNWNMSLTDFLYGCPQASFTEEVLFRAFLFGILYRRAGWSLWAATLFDGIVFGAVHVYQGDSFTQAAMVFVATGAGAVWFSWLLKEWNWNLWVPVCLHFLMNFWWGGFEMADNAAGGVWANVFRVMTITFTVVVTNRPALKALFAQLGGKSAHEQVPALA